MALRDEQFTDEFYAYDELAFEKLHANMILAAEYRAQEEMAWMEDPTLASPRRRYVPEPGDSFVTFLVVSLIWIAFGLSWWLS